MKNPVRIAIGAALLVLIGLGWYGYSKLEHYWRTETNFDLLYGEKKMLAAKLFLASTQTVSEFDSMPEALRKPLPNGTMLMASNQGFLLPNQVTSIMQWVENGNTLIMIPRDPDELRDRAVRRKREAARKDKEDEDEDKAASNESASNASVESSRENDDEDDVEDHKNDTEKSSDSKEESSQEEANEADNVAASEKFNPANKLDLDPLGKIVQVKLADRPVDMKCKRDECKTTSMHLAPLPYSLMLGHPRQILVGPDREAQLVAADKHLHAVRIYRQGKGHIVTIAQNYFTNRLLQHYDHAELLLHLTQLNRNAKHTIIIKNLDFTPWYQALWDEAYMALISLAFAGILLLWMGLRRFGNLLPEPVQIRRALIEHIDASARWLWHLPAGAELLLSAARANTSAILQRRIPEWNRLSPQEQVARLEGEVKLSQQQLWHALHEKAATQALAFTEQVQTLQILRKQYERK